MAKLPTTTKQDRVPSAFSRALSRLRNHKETMAKRKPVRIGFVIDATSSRDATWNEAQAIQARMFRSLAAARAAKLRVVHFGGSQVSDMGWHTGPEALARRMAEVRCMLGATQILPALTAYLEDREDRLATSIILIGDCFEEDPSEIEPLAIELRGLGIKVFAFLEGRDERATQAFTMLAEMTDGKFAAFGEDLPLADLCEGVALLTGGGTDGAARIQNRKVKRLLLGKD